MFQVKTQWIKSSCFEKGPTVHIKPIELATSEGALWGVEGLTGEGVCLGES